MTEVPTQRSIKDCELMIYSDTIYVGSNFRFLCCKLCLEPFRTLLVELSALCAVVDGSLMVLCGYLFCGMSPHWVKI